MMRPTTAPWSPYSKREPAGLPGTLGRACRSVQTGKEDDAVNVAQDLSALIGNTPLLELKHFAPGVLVKLESFNPLSSAKDRAGTI